jgi:hypothetical protein
MQLLQLVDARVEEASRPLRDEVAALKLLLARVGVSLEPTGACTYGDTGLALAQASLPLDSTEQKSFVVEEDHLHGCFSPRGNPCMSPQPVSECDGMGEILDPLLQITTELNELCGEPSVVVVSTTPSPPPSEPCQTLARVDIGGLDASDSLSSVDIGHVVSLSAASIEASEVAAPDLQIMPVLQGLPSEPCQPPDHVDSGGLDASVSLSSVAFGHVVSLSDEIVDASVLAPNSEALFAKELSDLLVSLEAASPGYGMEIASVLAGNASDDIIRKVEKSLRRKKKKRVISWKFTRLLD